MLRFLRVCKSLLLADAKTEVVGCDVKPRVKVDVA